MRKEEKICVVEQLVENVQSPPGKGVVSILSKHSKVFQKASVARVMQMILKSQAYLVGCLESGNY